MITIVPSMPHTPPSTFAATTAGWSMDEIAFEVGERLTSTFNVQRARPTPCPGLTPIGIEVEVPWSSYFPDLWVRFGLDKRKVRSLSLQENLALNEACSALEKDLLPRLHQTVACGVPRGNDRYWEFALDPVCDVTLLTHQIEVLSQTGLLPRNRRHSLQVTVGNVRATSDVYYMAMLLELHCIDGARVLGGLNQAQAALIHTGWARKGEAGVYQKNGQDLKHGSTVACEIRMLELPTDTTTFEALMRDASLGANAIAQVQQGIASDVTERWAERVEHLKAVLLDHGLPPRRWQDRQVDRAVWERFAEQLPSMRTAVLG